MVKLIFIVIISLAISCNNNENTTQQNTPLTKKDTAKDNAVAEQINQGPDSSLNLPLKKEERKLRYLFYANGGLVGYFNDGTVAACPRCDLLKENIKSLYTAKIFKTYIVEKDGSLLVNGTGHEYPKEKDKNGNKEWAMIDYKWLVNL